MNINNFDRDNLPTFIFISSVLLIILSFFNLSKEGDNILINSVREINLPVLGIALALLLLALFFYMKPIRKAVITNDNIDETTPNGKTEKDKNDFMDTIKAETNKSIKGKIKSLSNTQRKILDEIYNSFRKDLTVSELLVSLRDRYPKNEIDEMVLREEELVFRVKSLMHKGLIDLAKTTRETKRCTIIMLKNEVDQKLNELQGEDS